MLRLLLSTAKGTLAMVSSNEFQQNYLIILSRFVVR